MNCFSSYVKHLLTPGHLGDRWLGVLPGHIVSVKENGKATKRHNMETYPPNPLPLLFYEGKGEYR